MHIIESPIMSKINTMFLFFSLVISTTIYKVNSNKEKVINTKQSIESMKVALALSIKAENIKHMDINAYEIRSFKSSNFFNSLSLYSFLVFIKN